MKLGRSRIFYAPTTAASATIGLCARPDFLGRRDRTINALYWVLRALAALERQPKHRPHDPQYRVDRPIRIAPLAQPVAELFDCDNRNPIDLAGAEGRQNVLVQTRAQV
ncbi:MAG: hypothetical protein ABSD31_19075, partial [Candidatus Binataceae bacterium]